jgi:asparagine synthase (glutamine-hydrolysing)
LRTATEVVAVGMSGGLDSCSIAASASRLSTRPQIRPVSLAFDRLIECDERRYSELMISRVGLPILYCDAERVPFLADTPEFQPSSETPFLGDESANGDALTMARDAGATVYLTGHAGRYGLYGNGPAASASRLLHGDLSVLAELRRYAVGHDQPMARLIGAHLVEPLLPTGLRTGVRRALGRAHDDWLPEWLRDGFVVRTGLADRAREPAMRVRARAGRRDYHRAVELAAVGRAVYWYDRAAAQRGMEARHPFLDRRLVEFLFSIPPGEIAGPGEDRRILRRAMAGRLPEEIRRRGDKTSFLPRVRQGLVGAKPRIATLFDDRAMLQSLGVVDSGSFRAALHQLDDAPASLLGAVYFTTTLENWLRHSRGAGHEREHHPERSGTGAQRSAPGPLRTSHAH